MKIRIQEDHFQIDEKSKDRTFSNGDLSLLAKSLPKNLDFELFDHEGFFPPSVRPEKPSLVSSAHGSLKRVLLTIPDYVTEESEEKSTQATGLKSLIKNLPSYTDLVIFTHDNEESKKVIDEWLKEAGKSENAEFVLVEEDLNFLVWAEDAYAVAKNADDDKTHIIEPFLFRRVGDSLIADYLEAATDLNSTQVPVYFQGGNILIGDDFFMIGRDYPVKTIQVSPLDFNFNTGSTLDDQIDSTKEFYKRYMDVEKELLFVGNNKPFNLKNTLSISIDEEFFLIEHGRGAGERQPIFHIDMLISLMGRDADGRYTVAVGDPGLASEILNKKEPNYLPLHANAQNIRFKEVADQLSSEGFNVVRNPLPYVYQDKRVFHNEERGFQYLSDTIGRKNAEIVRDEANKEGKNSLIFRQWYFATSNNVLTEITEESKKVWLPTYGHGNWSLLKHTDEKNKKIWKDQDFEVIELDDFHPFSYRLGAAHCISKYLERG